MVTDISPCNFDAAVAGSSCFRCLEPNQLEAVTAYILWQNWLAEDAEAPADINALMAASKTLTRLTHKQLLAIIALTLCNLTSQPVVL